MIALLAALSAGLILGAAPSRAATVAGTVLIDGRPAGDAIVYLEGSDRAPTPTTNHAVMDQRNLMFQPRVLPVLRGTTIEFTNSDDIQHNVFSPSASAGKFDLGAYGPGAARSVTLDEPGEVVVLCNIHMEMEARILVLNEPYFAQAAADGTYRIAAVPPGRYTARVWQDGLLPVVRTVDIADDGDVVLNLEGSR
jgi:plastocyanin